MQILIVYGSLEGQTKKIAERIATILEDKGHEVTTLPGGQAPADLALERFDAAIVGGPIHMGKFPKPVKQFVATHRDWLNTVPGALFTVCMAINSEKPGSREQAIRYGEDFLRQSGWRPRLSATFAGAVKYTQYDFVTRFIMKMISKREGASTDTTHDHEYTDWDSVAHFAEEFQTVLGTATHEQTDLISS
jgi:menaquinone-dependent protoporphyrinogen oxidase